MQSIKAGRAMALARAGATYKRPSDAELKKRLTPLQFAVTRKDFTETPYRNEYWNNHEAGIYVDVISGAVAITEEPEAGVTAPTGPMVLVATVGT